VYLTFNVITICGIKLTVVGFKMADVNMQNESLLINQSHTGFGNMSGGDFAPPVSVQATFSVLYTLIIVLAVGGNGIVCYIITSSRHMRTITNFFLLNLAISDIIMAVLCIPFSFISNIVLAHWPFGTAMCPIMTYAQTVSVFLSSLTLVAISLDRLIAVTRPLRQRMTMKQLVVTVILIWVVALGISLPVAIVSRLEPFEHDPSLYWCKEAWPDEEQRLRYSIAILVLQYFLPLSVLIFTYTWIGIIVWGKRPPGEAEAKRDQRIASSKRRVSICAIFSHHY
jgi:neuropeptide Y receptor